LGAGGVEAEVGGVAEIVDRSGERGDVTDEIVAGILAVEEIEEFGEGAELEPLAEVDVAADAEINLVKRSSAELIERGLYAVDNRAIVAGETVVADVSGSGHGEGAGAFELREGGEFEAPGKLKRANDHEAVTDVFAAWAVVAGAERIERIRNAVHVIEEFADDCAPGGGVRENVVGGQLEAIGKAMLKLYGEAVVAGSIVGPEERDVGRSGRQ